MMHPELRSGLESIRRRRLLLIGAWAALPLVLLAHAFAPWSPETRRALVLAWVGAYGFATLAVAFSRCPRCRSLFHAVLGFHNPLASTCASCDLPVAPEEAG